MEEEGEVDLRSLDPLRGWDNRAGPRAPLVERGDRQGSSISPPTPSLIEALCPCDLVSGKHAAWHSQ